MNATKLALLMLSLVLLASTPVQAEDEPEPEDDPCPAIQTRPYDPYVTVHPDCLDETVAWTLQQV